MKQPSTILTSLQSPSSKIANLLFAILMFVSFAHLSTAGADESKCSDGTVLGSTDKKCEQPPDTVQHQVLSPKECVPVTSSELPMCSNSTTSVPLTGGCSQGALSCQSYGPGATGTTPNAIQVLEGKGGSKKSGVKQ